VAVNVIAEAKPDAAVMNIKNCDIDTDRFG
jgi:hypothetical protein